MRHLILSLCIVVFGGVLSTSVVFANHEAGHTGSGTDLLNSVLDQLNNPTNAAQPSAATGFSRDGVYGCTGGAYGAVGMQGPGGSHVPVFDDAVHDQERLITYKECLLDGIVNSMRETLISFIIKSVVLWTNQGLDGNPAFITNLPLHMLERVADPAAERIITGPETAALAGPFRRDVRVALARNYSQRTRSPESALRCDLSDAQIQALSENDIIGAGGWGAYLQYSIQPSCNPFFAYQNASARVQDVINADISNEQTQLDWGSGFQTVERTRTVDVGAGRSISVNRVVTPGFMIAEHLRQTIGTGLRQSENADEIDEIISALMANIGTQMLTDLEGLAGLSSSFGGQAPYVDRVAADSAARTRSSLVGAATAVVNNTLRVEQEYGQTRQSSVSSLTQSRRQLEVWEATCWTEIIDKAKQDVRARVQSQSCSNSEQTTGVTASSTTCSSTVSVTETKAADVLAIHAPTASGITVAGRASKGDSSMGVAAAGAVTLVGPVQPTVTTTGDWITPQMDLTPLPDGAITVRASETLSGGGGTRAPLTASVQKVTTPSGIELTLPVALPAVTITATAGTVTESVTLPVSRVRSRAVIDQSVTPILNLVRDNIARAAKALEVLTQLRAAVTAATSASGQRFVLEKIDQLVAARVLHTESQLRQARDQTIEIEAAMQQLLEETREGWEASWCKPENWEQLAS